MALEISTRNKPAVTSPRSIDLNQFLTVKRKIAGKDRMFFIEQLALMLETGSDLRTSLDVLAKQTAHPELKAIIMSLSEAVSEGQPFSGALARHPELFSTTYISLIAASEAGGYIRRILEHLLQMEKQREELRNSLISAISYPAFLMVFSLGMVVFILAVVFPKFGTLFVSIHDQLPVTTLFLMAVSDGITHYWWLIVPAFSALIAGFVFWVKSNAGSRVVDELKLTLPVIKNIFIKLYLIQTMRILSLSLKNGVNLTEALELAKGVVKNQGFNHFLDKLLNDVIEGRSLAHGFNTTAFIPPIVQQMVTTGEATGNLALVSDRIADYFQQDLEKVLKLVTKAIEPLMLLVMGVVVGVLVSSLILPIFKLSHAVH